MNVPDPHGTLPITNCSNRNARIADRADPPAQCKRFDIRVAMQLAAATNLEALDAAFSKARNPSLPLIALYRSLRLKLNDTPDEEQRYWDALPHTKRELWCIYELTSRRPISETPAVSQTVYEMFDRAAAIAHKQRRGYGQLKLPGTPGLLNTDRHEMASAIRQLSPKEQRRLCDGVIDKDSDAEIGRKCRAKSYARIEM